MIVDRKVHHEWANAGPQGGSWATARSEGGLRAAKGAAACAGFGQPTVRKTFIPSFIHTARIYSVALPTGTVLSTRDTAGNQSTALEEWPVIPVAEGAQ